MNKTDQPTSITSTFPYHEEAQRALTYHSGERCELSELLAVLLGKETDRQQCSLIASIGIHALSQMTTTELTEVAEITEENASRIVAAFGLAKKVAQRKEIGMYASPSDIAYLLMDEMRHLTQEHFVCFYLNNANRVLSKRTVFIGTLNTCYVHPREVFTEAIRLRCSSIIIAHNHPTGRCEPSPSDIELTNQLIGAGRILGIELLDHIIIGDGQYRSLKYAGYMN